MRANRLKQLQVLGLGVVLGACGSDKAGPNGSSAPEESEPAAYYCKEWPDAAEYCGGPTLSAEAAFAKLEASHLLKVKERLFYIESSHGGGFAPDGQQILTGDGWGFLYDTGDGSTDRWLAVRADPIVVGFAQASCAVGQVGVDGMTRQIQAASDLIRTTYAATFEPGTFSLFVWREASCHSSSGFARTIVQAILTNPPRKVNVEFDEKGALVGICELPDRQYGCR